MLENCYCQDSYASCVPAFGRMIRGFTEPLRFLHLQFPYCRVVDYWGVFSSRRPIISAYSNVLPFLLVPAQSRQYIYQLLMQNFLQAYERLCAVSRIVTELIDKMWFADVPFFLALEWSIGCVPNVMAQNANWQWITHSHIAARNIEIMQTTSIRLARRVSD